MRAQLDQEVEQRKQLEETYERELLAVRERYQSYVTSQIAQQDEPTSSDLENDLKRVYTPVAVRILGELAAAHRSADLRAPGHDYHSTE